MALPYYLRVEIDSMLQEFGASTIFWYDDANPKPSTGEQDVLYLKKDLSEKSSWNSTSENYIIKPTYIQSDWNETDPNNPAYIVNKPDPTPEPPEGGEILYFENYSAIEAADGEVDNLYVDNSDGQIYLWSLEEGFYPEGRKAQVRSDWAEEDPNKPSYILNKPEEEGQVPFITVWNVAVDETIVLPVGQEGVNQVRVDWGDGTINRQTTHTYSSAGEKTISITGRLEDFRFNGSNSSRTKLIEITQWGDIEWANINFRGCINLTIISATDAPNLSACTSLQQFLRNTGITSVNANIFSRANNVTTVVSLFQDSQLQSITEGLLNNMTKLVDASYIFKGTPLTGTIGSNLFINCPLIQKLDSAFRDSDINTLPDDLFHGLINLRSIVQIFQSTNITEIPFGFFKFCRKLQDLTQAFVNLSPLVVASDFSDYFLYPVRFFQTFQNTTIDGDAPRLWLYFPNAEGSECYRFSNGMDNSTEIPESWGGNSGVPMPPQIPVRVENFWNGSTNNPEWLINGVWRTVDGTGGGSESDIIERYDSFSLFPTEGFEDKLYVDEEELKSYLWDDFEELYFELGSGGSSTPQTDVISYALSAPSSDLSSGDTDSFLAPYDFTLTNYFVGVSEAPSGSALVVGLKKNDISVTSSDAIIDSGEFNSLTGTSPVLTTQSFQKGDLITPVISQTGSLETGKSLKIYLEITKT